ncbi:hypothetical protein NYA30BAC_03990 [Halomonas sp. NYA30]
MSRERNKLLDKVCAQRYHVGVYLLGANMVGGKETKRTHSLKYK